MQVMVLVMCPTSTARMAQQAQSPLPKGLVQGLSCLTEISLFCHCAIPAAPAALLHQTKSLLLDAALNHLQQCCCQAGYLRCTCVMKTQVLR